MTITKTIIEHLCDNRGDENISKMTWVAIIFVVGAILLLLTTTAFKEPIKNWYDDTVVEWFSAEHGQYSYDEWSTYEKNENGTYKGMQYVLYFPSGGYQVMMYPSEAVHNGNADECYMMTYDANGNWDGCYWNYMSGTIQISNDGKTITIDGDEYHAQLP